MLIIGQSGSRETNVLLLMHYKKKIMTTLLTKFYLYAKYLIDPKYQFLIKKREDAGIKSAFIGYSNTMNNV